MIICICAKAYYKIIPEKFRMSTNPLPLQILNPSLPLQIVSLLIPRTVPVSQHLNLPACPPLTTEQSADSRFDLVVLQRLQPDIPLHVDQFPQHHQFLENV